jgi:phage terminase small subunit
MTRRARREEVVPWLAAPVHLSEKARALWDIIVPRRAKSPERRAVLQVALEALDRADEAAAVIRREGLVSLAPGSKVVHVPPPVKVEREARQLFVKTMAKLSLTWDEEIDGGNPL